jgi:transcriptional regulator with XRE-family HTH domain
MPMTRKQNDDQSVPTESRDQENDYLAPFLGPLLLRARRAAGIKQEVLARKIDINDATLRRIETGQGPVRPKNVRAICRALGADYQEIVTEALFTYWKSLTSRESSPLRILRARLLTHLEAHQKTQRELIEAYLDFESFVHFKTKWDDVAP